MTEFEYLVNISRRLKGTRGEGQKMSTWRISKKETVQELLDLLNSKTPGGRPVEL